MQKHPGNGHHVQRKGLRYPVLAVLLSLFLTLLLFQNAYAFRFDRVADFDGWWEWTNSPDSVDFYYYGDSVKIHSHVAPLEDHAWGNVAQECYASSIGVMTSMSAENVVGYAKAGIVYYNIGRINDHEVEAQIFLEKLHGSNDTIIGYLVRERLPEGSNELARDTIATVTGTTFTIAVARVEKEIFFYLEGYPLKSFSPAFSLGSQGYKWGVFATTTLEGNVEATFSDIYAIDTGEPRPRITANGSSIPITVSPTTPVSIDIALDPGDEAGRMADWWVAVNTPFPPPNNWYTYVYPLGWQPGMHLCAQTPLFNLSPVNVLNATLPEGNYTFYFAVDNNADGVPDAAWMDSVAVSVSNPAFFDAFPGPSLDGNKWDLNAIWNGNNIDTTEYFLDPHIASGNLVLQDKGNLPLLKNNNQAYTGIPSKSRVIHGDFEFVTHVRNLQVSTTAPGLEGWWGSVYIRLETDRGWDVGQKIHVRAGPGNEHSGDLNGFGLFYFVNGVAQNIGCPYSGGTNCWMHADVIQGDRTKITVRRTGSSITIHIGDTLLHSFDGATTEDLYITWNTGVWNELSGTLLGYYAEIPEVWVFPK